MNSTNTEPGNENWQVPKDVDVSSFDFGWRPDPYDPPFIHQFPTQWQKTGGPRYVVPGATQVKYHDSQRAIARAKENNRRWRNTNNLIFDYSWHPDDTEPLFIYQFANQWQKTGGPRYVVPGATEVKYMQEPIATHLPCLADWQNHENHEFDYSWLPNEHEPPLIYQFANQWQKTGGPRYVVPGATQVKYIEFPSATVKPNLLNWQNHENHEFDYSWLPNEHEPPLIYQFANQWQKTGGPRYVVPGATQVKYIEFPVAKHLAEKKNGE